MRKTAQVIIEMIDEAKESLYLSSFTFYKVREIIDHLKLAQERNVVITLLLETPQSSHYKVKSDPIKHLEDDLREKACLSIWPNKNRLVEGYQQTGSLHAKFVLQDRSKLFVSSANLTQSAMDRNMELRVIIEDVMAIDKFHNHLDHLISENIITRI